MNTPVGEDDLKAEQVFRRIFTEATYQKHNFGNACATRLSLGLLNSGIVVPTEFTMELGAFKGKGVTTSALNMLVWLIKKFGNPDICEPNSYNFSAFVTNPWNSKSKLTKITDSQIILFKNKIGQKKGIYAMIPYHGIDFGASGHVSLWHTGKVIGGHDYFNSAGLICFWELK